jgi:hypothetical protein
LLGLRRSPSHPVADKGIKHFAVSGDGGFDLFPDALFLVCSIESDLGHGGLLASLSVMMCRRRHRIARWIGVASHRREIGIPKRNGVAANLGRPLCRGYERGQGCASISYAVIRIFNSSQQELTVEMQDGPLPYQR